MSNCNRTYAINQIAVSPVLPPCEPRPANIDDYGIDVFNEDSIRKYLSKGIAEKLLATIEKGVPIDPAIAGDVAHAMKEWAIDRGATHYTHWFQPLTGGTAEKHDSFVSPVPHGQAVFAFSGKNLVVGEPDASSFPSGGIRSTFEARGYTAWDPSSPAFIKRHANGATLCIPTAFCSYTGDVLDKKTPLLRSIQALKRSVNRLMKCFGVPEDTPEVSLGPEQEYFLIDKKFYLNRPDLLQTGRTLFGAPPPKHQQLEDHYFGAIKPRIIQFMTEVEQELWKLGIPAKTRHNEVAPAQFELAPVFEDLNVAVDHNMLVMETLRQVADRHGLVCLLHEKPFAGINGSGKHNNWSIGYGKRNLLDPGNDPEQNMIFLTVLSAILRGVDLHADLLRSTTCSINNDHRLGANEAPPAIVSIFLGEQLEDIIDQIAKGAVSTSKKAGTMRIGVDILPTLPRDATDRNRTSPFAFTGNKFEFRAPGSSRSCAGPNIFLNTIVAESLDFISERLEKASAKDFNEALLKIIRDIVAKHRRIVFNGNGYSAEWEAEAARRGLPNLKTTPEALKPLLETVNQKLMEKYGVFSKVEMDSRYEVFLEEYHRKLRIEGEIALEIATSMILPIAATYYGRLSADLASAAQGKLKAGTAGLRRLADQVGAGIDRLDAASDALRKAIAAHNPKKTLAAMTGLRDVVDALELLVDDACWPLPKYREMLFIY
ncbi:MAG: glutamine synthetase type III [Lentisphaerae bacterium]|nr:glutamine synthetase type III [Lentisphaerota bacterium]